MSFGFGAFGELAFGQEPTTTENILVSPSDLTVAIALEAVDLNTFITFYPADLLVSTLLEEVDVQEQHVFVSPTDLLVATYIETVTLTQTSRVAPIDLTVQTLLDTTDIIVQSTGRIWGPALQSG